MSVSDLDLKPKNGSFIQEKSGYGVSYIILVMR